MISKLTNKEIKPFMTFGKMSIANGFLNREKIGKYSPGKHIPIKAMDYFYNNIPDVAFLFAWNHKKEIFEKEKKFSENGEWIAHVEL